MKRAAILLLSLLCCWTLSGCSKEEALGFYNAVISAVGDLPLTEGASLQGERAFGADHYTGTYAADYEHFSRREILFGGICVDRETGDELAVTCTLTVKSGAAQVFWQSGNEQAATLIDAGGTYSGTITMSKAGNYIGIECFDFTGNLDLRIE